MTDRILGDIFETEAEAAEIELRAELEAKDLIREARLQSHQLSETGLLEEERRFAEAVAEMEATGESLLSRRLGESAAAVGTARAKAMERFEAAVSLIVKEIAGDYGHC